MSEELRAKVSSALEKSGFPLEMRMAAICSKTGFEVQQSVYYADPETQEARETDVVAWKENVSSAAWVRFYVVIECKATKEAPWVFFPRHKGKLEPRDRILSLAASRHSFPLLSRIARRGDILKSPAFKESPAAAYGMVQVLKDKPDHAFAAAIGVAKAASVLLESSQLIAADEEAFEIAWPVIVTEAPLFQATLASDGSLAVEAVNRGVLAWSHPTAGRSVRLIDVVHPDEAEGLFSDIHTAADLILFNTASEQEQALEARRRNIERGAQTA
jgi:hypothetical protein